MAGCFQEKLKWCLSELVCRESNVSSALNGPEDWIQRYIRICLYFTVFLVRRIFLCPFSVHVSAPYMSIQIDDSFSLYGNLGRTNFLRYARVISG